MTKAANYLLIIANSARMLAQAARNAGLIPYVIDCYGDLDTQQLAEQFFQVKSLSIPDLMPAIEFFKQQNITQLVYGSGFEEHSNSLIFLARYFKILGNLPKTFIALDNKRDFFSHLQRLNIPFPEVRFVAPENTEGWLIKPQHSLGGINIRWAEKLAHPPLFYYQRFVQGKSLSALFLANGKQAQIIGYNQQLVTSFETEPFVFSAIRNHVELPLKQKQILSQWLNQLTAVYGLRGLNSLDFILAENSCYVLEINPRPPASMQLYDKNLLMAHITSSLDLTGFKNLSGLETRPKLYQVYQIIYAPTQIQIPTQIAWPQGFVDIPQHGAVINKNQPVCSIIARGKNLVELSNDLQLKHSFLSTFF